MALTSMTGHGVGSATAGGVTVDIELSAVNRKQLDVRLSLPRSLTSLEPRVGEMVQKQVVRGSVTGTVRVRVSDQERVRGVRVNETLARNYVATLRRLAGRLKLTDDLSASALLSLPEVVEVHEPEEDIERMWRLIQKALGEALKRLTTMRRLEGAALARDIGGRMKKLGGLVGEIERFAPRVAERYRDLLRKRLEAAGLPIPADDPALLREVALMADRADIAEEITRLRSHLHQFEGLLRDAEPVGRTMDFVCQEIFREINTIGSKANDAAIARCVVKFKATLERVREQVQNVE